ncbi:MAG: 2-oxoacid:acceptor oxidoreductase subunit alpha, partial [Paenibacillus sp.]|nr:2-oxoacid:acceptor oxidoreductase subunit alpha [Paenibacillus sp.]
RAFTASSGPGLSLMMEAIGLSGMTEQPLVIVNTMRGGPSTGLPTKQEQSDLMQMIYGTHGEIPKIVIAPSSIEDCFYDMIEAFNLAEKYQCPVIVMTDLQLSLGKQSCAVLDYDRIVIDRGRLVRDVPELETHGQFKRYEFTENGISPRVLPGEKGGLHHVTGVEHDEVGRPSESAINRQRMMDKRLGKLKSLEIRKAVVADAPYEEPDVLIIGMGSTGGTIDQARIKLEQEGWKTNHLTIRQIHPFPTAQVKRYTERAKQIIVLENNATGQLADQLKLNVDCRSKLTSMIKYDGTPFLPQEVYSKSKELVLNGNLQRVPQ